MIKDNPQISGAFMPESTNQAPGSEQHRASGGLQGPGRLLQQRLDLVEDLWQNVLRSECPPEQSERLLRLKQLSDPIALEGRDGESTSEAVVELIRAMTIRRLPQLCVLALFPADQHSRATHRGRQLSGQPQLSTESGRP